MLQKKDIDISVAKSLEDLLDSFKVRTCAFVMEQDCPDDDEFDGNDYSGTHIVAKIDGKTVATTRLRYFADFVKIERIAILKQHRDLVLFNTLVDYILEFIERKGFTKSYTQADTRMQRVYKRYGYLPMGNQEPIEHFGSTYVAMIRDIGPEAKSPITIHSHHSYLNAREGTWLAKTE